MVPSDPSFLSHNAFKSECKVNLFMGGGFKLERSRVDSPPDPSRSRLNAAAGSPNSLRILGFPIPYFDDGGHQDQYLPVNLRRIIQDAPLIWCIDRRQLSDHNPVDTITPARKLCKDNLVVRGHDLLSREAQENATLLFPIHLRTTFASKVVLEDYNLNRESFEWVLAEVETKFNLAVAHPGEICGMFTAQYTGEPRIAVNARHLPLCRCTSKDVTAGVLRLKEMINVATIMTIPSLTVILTSENAVTQTEIAHTSLKTVTASASVIFDPEPSATTIDEGRNFGPS